MFILANFIDAVAWILEMGLSLYMWVIIARAILSWVNPDPYNPIVRFIYQATEPVLYRVRRFLPFMGALDISPIVVMAVIFFLKKFFIATLIDIAFRLKTGGHL